MAPQAGWRVSHVGEPLDFGVASASVPSARDRAGRRSRPSARRPVIRVPPRASPTPRRSEDDPNRPRPPQEVHRVSHAGELSILDSHPQPCPSARRAGRRSVPERAPPGHPRPARPLRRFDRARRSEVEPHPRRCPAPSVEEPADPIPLHRPHRHLREQRHRESQPREALVLGQALPVAEVDLLRDDRDLEQAEARSRRPRRPPSRPAARGVALDDLLAGSGCRAARWGRRRRGRPSRRSPGSTQ